VRIATYDDGRSLNYDKRTGQFDVGGAPVSRDDVLAFDRADQLAWRSAAMRDWLYGATGSPSNPYRKPPSSGRKGGCAIAILVGAVGLCGLCAFVGSLLPSVPGAGTGTGRITTTIGQPVATAALEVMVSSVQPAAEVGSEYMAVKPADGGEFIIVEWSYKNISDKPMSALSKPRMNLVNSAGVSFDPDLNASSRAAAAASASEKVLSDLNPGITVKAVDVFEIQKGTFGAGWTANIAADTPVIVTF